MTFFFEKFIIISEQPFAQSCARKTDFQEENMKKKILATLLAATMVLAACGNPEVAQETPVTSEPAAQQEEAAPAEVADLDFSAGGNITVWVAEEMVEFTKAQFDAFIAANPDYSAFTVTVEPVGEGDAAGNMITDVEGGADIFGFAQDQLARLVSAGAVMPVTGDYAATAQANNDEGSVGAATVGGTMYAFPLTSDNGYFLYYDKSVVTDPSTLEGIVADCEAAGKNFYFEINSAWYQTAFFFGAGCELTYETDDEGNFTKCNSTYASENGVKALRAMCTLAESKAFQNGSSMSNATNVGAIVDGVWDAEAAKEVFGDNYACAKLPTFDGVQMSGFGGFKLLGVKPQEDAAKLKVCQDLAQYLSSEEVQLARFEAKGWGPSNINAQANEAVKSNEALSALAEQLKFSVPQGQYPGDYWSLGTSLGDDVINGTIKNSMSDDELMAALQNFEDTCISYAQ